MTKLYNYLRLLSIDVALGAGFTSILYYILTGLSVHFHSVFAVVLVVWLIYTLDHLIDSKRIDKFAILPRRKFHQKYFKILLISWVIVGFSTVFYILNTLYPITIYLGILCFIMVCFHFFLIVFLGWKVSIFITKEIGIALIYSIGVAIPALSNAFLAITFPIIVTFLQIFLIALVNLLEISFFEAIEDQKEGQTSMVRALGKTKSKRIIIFLLILNILIGAIAGYIFPYHPFILVEVCLQIMNATLLIIFIRRKYFALKERYRIIGDAIFFLPALFLFFL